VTNWGGADEAGLTEWGTSWGGRGFAEGLSEDAVNYMWSSHVPSSEAGEISESPQKSEGHAERLYSQKRSARRN